jgi:hypothetical protein
LALQTLTQQQASKREAQAAENRRRFPELAEFIDARKAEGNTVKLIWAINRNGDELGQVPDEVRADPFLDRWYAAAGRGK